MNRRHFLTSLGGGAISFTQGQAAPTDTAAGLQEKLEALRQKHRVPALAAARVRVDGLAIQTVTGFRKAGGSTPVTPADLWHYGSMTKAMTATLLATYVQEGRLHWDDSLGKLIPESCRKAHPRTKDITVLQLLQHRSGLRANLLSWWLLPRADQRGEILRLAAPPGADWPEAGSYLYSNVGYAIAGHLAEKLDGQTWETLLEKRLFRPLKITAGQGPAGTDQLLVLVSDTPRDLKALTASLPDAAAPFTFSLNDLPGRAALIDFFAGRGVTGGSESFGAKLLSIQETP